MNPSQTGISGRGRSSGEIIPEGFSKARLKNFDKSQMDLYDQANQLIGKDSYLSRLAGGDENLLRESEAPAWRDFQQAQGQLGSRFSNMGMGTRRGSGFQNAGGQQANDFAMQLQANRQNLMRQAMNDLMGFSNQMLNQRPYSQSLVENKQQEDPWNNSVFGQFAQGFGPILSTAMGMPDLGGLSNTFGGGGMKSGSLSSGGNMPMSSGSLSFGGNAPMF